MKVLNYKFLGSKKKSSITFNYYYKVLAFDIFYKENILKGCNTKLFKKVVNTLYVHGGKHKYISWFKFFFIWLRNIIGISFGLFKKRRLKFFKSYDSFSYLLFVYLDYFRFYLYPMFLQRYRIVKKQFFSSENGLISQIHYMDYLTASGNIFYKFFDMFLKARYFSTYLKERPLYLDSVDYSSSFVISFFFSKSSLGSEYFFSLFGYYSLDLNTFFLEKGNRFSYGLKIL